MKDLSCDKDAFASILNKTLRTHQIKNGSLSTSKCVASFGSSLTTMSTTTSAKRLIYASELWKKLENLYAAKSGSNKLFYLTKLVRTKYRDGSSVVDHFNEFQGIVDELHGMGAKLLDELLGLFVLTSLPESWDTLKMSITSIASKGVVNIEDVKGSILNEKMR